jgi:MFS family permease
MDPLHSGLLTCASAIGALFMKTMTIRILRRWGFRRVLVVNALAASAGMAACAAFTAATPVVVIFIVLLLAGCLRSLQFTALQAIQFADTSREAMSRATSLSSMAQRLSQSLGIAVGAWVLQFASDLRGDGLLLAVDFVPAFVAVALVAASSVLMHRKMVPDAGAEVSGHR